MSQRKDLAETDKKTGTGTRISTCHMAHACSLRVPRVPWHLENCVNMGENRFFSQVDPGTSTLGKSLQRALCMHAC